MIRFTITRQFPNRPLQTSYYSAEASEALRIILSALKEKVTIHGRDGITEKASG